METVSMALGLIKKKGPKAFAIDSYRPYFKMYNQVETRKR
jgi:hypothetical protein